MGDLKAIQTVYRGYKFRSRLEARWAVFFDALGIKWEYEAEGYDLDGLWYLPDFWFPELGYWAEVKGKEPDTDDEGDYIGDEAEKAKRLARISKKPVYLLCGPMDSEDRPSIIGYEDNGGNPIEGGPVYSFTRCPVCGRAGITFVGYVDEIGCGCFNEFSTIAHQLEVRIRESGDTDYTHWVVKLFHAVRNDDSYTINAAFVKAQQARFEHGEQP